MHARILHIVIFFLLVLPAQAQQRHWVFFADRGPDTEQRISRMLTEGTLSDEALQRRGGTPLAEDLPPYPAYVRAVEDCGAEVVAESRWLNAVSVRASLSQLVRIGLLPGVLHVQPVRTWQSVGIEPPALARTGQAGEHGLNYGFSEEQLAVIRVPDVHDIWIDGTGITVGMLDNGFRWRTHEAMKNIDVRGEFDVINQDDDTQNEEDENYGQDSHGTVTFSALAGFKEGEVIGPAFNAAYYLAKTEVDGSETQIEEDYWVEGIEWLETQGVAIVSASLAYSEWDDGTGYSYANGDYDGRTAVTTRAAVEAMRRGVVVVTAMGNEGPSAATLLAPSDADSIISVGAMTFTGAVAGFSSRGPTSDLRIKPDVCAPGSSVYSASKNGDDTYTLSSGTSLATPLTAGVAALVRSARPELTPVEVRDALRETASNAGSPDNAAGWGMVNAWDALLYNGMVISTNPRYYYNGSQTTILAWVVSHSPVKSDVVSCTYSVNGGDMQPLRMDLLRPYAGEGEGSGLYMVTLPELAQGSEVRYFITAEDGRETRTSPYDVPRNQHRLVTGETYLLGAENLLPADLALSQNYPNPYEPSVSAGTTITFDVPMPGGQVRLDLYDTAGRRVKTLVEGIRGAGTHSVRLDNIPLSSGVYIYALQFGGKQIMRRMLVLQ
ncbi:S8 family peptidase [bacterium]|nr:S8 family peptidase [bacterium]